MLTAQAHAKINLTLGVLGKRPDGYHDLCMLMQTVTLCDHLHIQEAAGGSTVVRNSLPYLPCDGSNLAAKAAAAFWAASSLPPRALEISIEKNIPVCAGLAGGSADAAAVLRALRDAYAPELSNARLAEIGFSVGSDVPYCVHGGTMLAEARGERLTPLPPLPDCYIVLCKPNFPVSTPALFERIDARRERCQPDAPGAIEALRAADLGGVARRLYNVFEDVLPTRRAQTVKGLKSALLSCGALGASMSGTGPSVFGLFDQEQSARQAQAELTQLCPQNWLVRPVTP